MSQTIDFAAFRDPEMGKKLIARLKAELDEPITFMEVCGTHTVALFQSGLHSVLPDKVTHLSGPGCPVCVTHDSEVAAYLELAEKDAVIATFGDLMRVPGPDGANLKKAQAAGARVQVVYSPMDALKLARDNPGDTVVFLGIGFETTAPTVAATLKTARAAGVSNLKAASFHKTVPPALAALAGGGEAKLDAFLLPGHVSALIGEAPYAFLAEEHGVPSVITGFDPLDILQALLILADMRRDMQKGGAAKVVNQYSRVVAEKGNPKAMGILHEVFRPGDALWRGIGMIPGSGLHFTEAYEDFDALAHFGVELREVKPLPGCKCGEVLKGLMPPNKCPLFKKACTPATPVGPCMVSTEGSCAAYFKYHLDA